MLSLQGKITLLAYSIIMISFFIPLKRDRSIDKKLALSIVMLIPISISIYSVNCLVKGSKWKFGLGCNVLAWINSLSVLVSAVILILVNLNKKILKDLKKVKVNMILKKMKMKVNMILKKMKVKVNMILKKMKMKIQIKNLLIVS
jgi:hypothetical protein